MDFEKIFNEIEAEKGAQPFSSGSEADSWVCKNCDKCIKSYESRLADDEIHDVDFKETQELVNQGRECIAKFALDFAFITSVMPEDVLKWMGAKIRKQKNGLFADMPSQCLHFSDNKNDNPDLRPVIEPIDPNQLLIPLAFDELFALFWDDSDDIIVTKHAVIERELCEF